MSRREQHASLVSGASTERGWAPAFLLLALLWGASFMFIKVGLGALAPLQVAHQQGEQIRAAANDEMPAKKTGATANDADYVFITFILHQLPHGVIGLLVAAFFAAALSSKSAELNALGSTTTIDFY